MHKHIRGRDAFIVFNGCFVAEVKASQLKYNPPFNLNWALGIYWEVKIAIADWHCLACSRNRIASLALGGWTKQTKATRKRGWQPIAVGHLSHCNHDNNVCSRLTVWTFHSNVTPKAVYLQGGWCPHYFQHVGSSFKVVRGAEVSFTC